MRILVVILTLAISACQNTTPSNTNTSLITDLKSTQPSIEKIVTNFEQNYPSIAITFSEDMQRLPASSLPIKLSPNSPCEWLWEDAKHLSCDSNYSSIVKPATRYSLSIGKGLYSMEGRALKPFKHDFESFRPAPENLFVNQWKTPILPELILSFNIGVTPESLKGNLYLKSRTGHKVFLDAEAIKQGVSFGYEDVWQENTYWRLKLKTKLRKHTTYYLMWKGSIKTTEGLLPAKSNRRYRDNYSLKTYGRFSYIGRTCREDYWGDEKTNINCLPGNPVELEFSVPIEPATIQSCLKEIEKQGFKVPEFDSHENILKISPLFADKTKKLTCLKNIKDIFGRSLPSDTVVEVGAIDFNPYFSLHQQNEVITSRDELQLDIYSVNKEAVILELDNIDFKPVSTYETIDIDSDKNIRTKTSLRNYYPDNTKQISGTFKNPSSMKRGRSFFIQKSQYNISINTSKNKTIIFVSDIFTNNPIPNISFVFSSFYQFNGEQQKTNYSLSTDKNGIAEVTRKKGEVFSYYRNRYHLKFENGEQLELNNNNRLNFEIENANDNYYGIDDGATVFWGLTDKPFYRPGETVNYIGFVRTVDGNKLLTENVAKDAKIILEGDNYNCYQKDCNLIYEEKNIQQDSYGRIVGSFTLPKSIEDGRYLLDLVSRNTRGYESDLFFDVANFKRQDIKAAVLPKTIDYLSSKIMFEASAQYYSGGAYKNAPVEIDATLKNVDKISEFDEYTDYVFTPNNCETCSEQSSYYFDFEGLDEKGKLTDSIIIPENDLNYGSIDFQATVILDTGDTVLSQVKSIDYKPRSYFVGLEKQGWWLPTGKDHLVKSIVVDLNSRQEKDIDVQYFIKKSDDFYTSRFNNSLNNDQESKEIKIQCVATQKKNECLFTPKNNGYHEIIARITYKDGKTQQTSSHHYFYGGKDDNKETIFINAKNPKVRVGDIGTLTINHPFGKTSSLITLHRGKILASWWQPLDKGLNEINFPIKENYSPGFDMTVQVFYDNLEVLGKSAEVDYAPIVSQHFDVESKKKPSLLSIKTDKQIYIPGKQIEVTLSNLSRENTGVLLAMIDQSILDQMEDGRYYQLDDSLLDTKEISWGKPSFYALSSRLYSSYSEDMEAEYEERWGENRVTITGSRMRRQDLEVASPLRMLNDSGPYSSDALQAPPNPSKPKLQIGSSTVSLSNLRQSFKDSAYWNPNIIVEAEKSKTIKIDLPDNLTQWTIFAISTNQSGDITITDKTIKTQKIVEVRSDLPSQLTIGDQFVHKPYAITRSESIDSLSLSSSAQDEQSQMLLAEGDKKFTSVTAFDRYSLAIPIQADIVGTTQILSVVDAFKKTESKSKTETKAESNNIAQDAILQNIPVYSRDITRTQTRYSILQLDKIVDFELPKNYSSNDATINIELSGSLLSQLAGTNEYMKDYPHQCWEQKSSRALVAALQIHSKDFQQSDLSQLESNIQDAISSFEEFQASSGGMAFFGKSDSSVSLYLSAYTYMAIQRMQKMGHKYSSRHLSLLENYLKGLISKNKTRNRYSKNVEEISIEQKILVLNALSQSNQQVIFVSKHIENFISGFSQLDDFSKGLMIETTARLPEYQDDSAVLAKQLLKNTRVTDKKRLLVSNRNLPWYYYNFDAKKYCAIISGLTAQSHDQRNVYQLINSALELRRKNKGDFGNTMSNAYCALAIHDYAEKYEKSRQLDDVTVNTQGKETVLSLSNIKVNQNIQLDQPLRIKINSGSEPLSKSSSKGVGYLKSTMSYVVDGTKLPEIINGFSIQRRYQVYKKRVWQDATQKNIEQGDFVKVTLNINNPLFRRYVAITDKIPGGFFALDESLSTSAPHELFDSLKNDFYFNEKQVGTRDAKFYADYLPAGNFVVEYLVKASYQGEFSALAAKVEEMYDDDVFSSTKAENIIIH